MDANGCQCERLENNCVVRQQRWREVCAKFYFSQDKTAKRVLEYFEASKVDEISISTVEDAGADKQFNELILFLGLQKCMVPGHEKNLCQTIQMLEVVKNDVRAGFHSQISNQRYAEFDTMVKESQGTNFDLQEGDNGQQQLSVRLQHDYLRSTENFTKMIDRMGVYITKHLSNVGCHPFLAGLLATLQWNLDSPTIVAWKLSDSVFIESGDAEFTHNTFTLLVLALNFGHCESVNEIGMSGANNDSRVKTRDWYLDPYMSDHDIRQLIQLFPAAKRLEGRPTGTKMTTKLDRVNVHGQRDETLTFLNRWCVVL